MRKLCTLFIPALLLVFLVTGCSLGKKQPVKRVMYDARASHIASSERGSSMSKTLWNGDLELTAGEKSSCSIVYNYRDDKEVFYKDIKLDIKGKNEASIDLFKEGSNGSSDFYETARVEKFKFNGDVFLQVDLVNGIWDYSDSFLYKLVGGKLEPVFNNKDYGKFVRNLFYKTDSRSNGVYEDKAVNFSRELSYKTLQANDKFDKNVIYSVKLTGFKRDIIEAGSGKKLKMTAQAYLVVDDTAVLGEDIEFTYSGSKFTPTKASVFELVWDASKTESRGQVKNLFEYPVK